MDMLRKLRITAAFILFTGLTLLFLDFTGTIHAYLGWMAKIQFLPALLASNLFVVVSILLFTIIFGRLYCSIICPLGIFQDIVAWITERRKKNRYGFKKNRKWLRYGIATAFIILLIFGFSSIAFVLAPYSILSSFTDSRSALR